MAKLMKELLRDERAATAVEYALLATLIALPVIAGLTAIGTRLSGFFSEASSALK